MICRINLSLNVDMKDFSDFSCLVSGSTSLIHRVYNFLHGKVYIFELSICLVSSGEGYPQQDDETRRSYWVHALQNNWGYGSN